MCDLIAGDTQPSISIDFRFAVHGCDAARQHERGVRSVSQLNKSRPPKLNAHQRKEAIARMRNGETQADIARTYGVDATTIGRLDCSAP
jgi:hypothetical protein